jgi:hypothetical protein
MLLKTSVGGFHPGHVHVSPVLTVAAGSPASIVTGCRLSAGRCEVSFAVGAVRGPGAAPMWMQYGCDDRESRR